MNNYINDESKNLLVDKLNSIIEFSKKMKAEQIDETQFILLQEMIWEFEISFCKNLTGNTEGISNDSSEKIISNLKEALKLYFYASLAFLLNLDKVANSKLIGELLAKLFDDYNYTISLLHMIFIKIYNNLEYTKLFFLPSLNKIINLMFKFPDKIANILEYTLINSYDYHYTLILVFFTNDNLKDELLSKIFKLRLMGVLIEVLKDHLEKNQNYFLRIFKTIEEGIFYDDFIETVFNAKVYNCDSFSNMLYIYKNLSINKFAQDYFSEKIVQLIQTNTNFVSLVLLSNNSKLINFYIKSIFNTLKNQKEKIDQMDLYTFYLILFSIFFYTERIDDKDLLLKVLKNILQIQGNILDKIFEDKMKKVFYLFSNYLKTKIGVYLKDTVNEHESCDLKLDEEENKIFNFQKTEEGILHDPLFISKLKEEYEIKILRITNNNVFNVKSEKNKTKYISVKFQKKYGHHKEKQNTLLELEEEPSINISLSSNLNSTFKLKLEKEDKFNDLEQLHAPIYLKDCLLGLSSQFPDRQKLSLESLPELIDSQPLDLDYLLPQICEAVIKLDNSFEFENFDDLIIKNLTRLTVYNPVRMTVLLCTRFFKEESGMKNKFQILSVIEKSSEEISDYYVANKKIPKVNKLHCFFENIIFPLLTNLKQMNIEKMIILQDFDYLLAKFITLVSKLIKFCENHPYIYKALFESFELFRAIVENNSFLLHKSLLLIDSLNFFSSVISKFLTSSFLQIYPEFFPNFKVILKFLNENIEKVNKEELKLEMLKNLNNYLTNLERLKESYTSNDSSILNLKIS